MSIDITYIRLRRGWVYLVALLDWTTRAVLSWRLSNTCDRFFCMRRWKRPCGSTVHQKIFNSDQVATFTSPDFTKPLLDLGVKISMDGKGRALDNIITERFWRTAKYDEVYLNNYGTMQEAKEALVKFIYKYNPQYSIPEGRRELLRSGAVPAKLSTVPDKRFPQWLRFLNL